MVAGLASTIFLPTSSALVDAYGWRHALLILAGILALATVLPHALVLRRDPSDLGLHPDGAPVAEDQALTPAAQPAGRLRDTAGWALRDRAYRWYMLGFAANTLAIIVISVHLVPYLREHGHSAAFAATAAGALGALSVTGRLVATGAFRRVSASTVTATIFALQGAAVLLLLAGGRSTAAAVGFVVVFGLGFGVGTIARAALLAERYGVGSYATLSGLMNVALTAAKTIGPLGAGLIRTVTGSYTAVLLALVVVCVLAAFGVARAGAMNPDGIDLPDARFTAAR